MIKTTCVSTQMTKKHIFFQPTPSVSTGQIQESHAKKPSYFPLYFLFNRDPYNGLL